MWNEGRNIKPQLTVVPKISSKVTVKALSFGDPQLYYRILGFAIQNAGDSFGRFTSLKEYDYKTLSQWFYLLDSLDSKSDFIPSVAGYYYSQTPNKEDVRYVVDYLNDHGSKNFEEKWWWIFQATYLATHKLNDIPLAKEIGHKLQHAPKGAPTWVRFFPVILLTKEGDKEQAFKLMRLIVSHLDELSDSERRFVEFFVKERLAKTLDE